MALSPARRSLAAYRRALAGHPLVSSLDVVAVSGASTTTSLVLADLAGGVNRDRYVESWVLPVDGTAANVGQMRRVGQDALNPSTGALTLSVALPATPAIGDEVEIHRLLPPRRSEGRTGLRECVNLALRELWFPDRVALNGVANQPSYSDLFTANDWADPEAVLELYGPRWDPSLNRVPWPSWGLLRDADLSALEVGPVFGAGEVAQVQMTRPGDTLVKRWTGGPGGPGDRASPATQAWTAVSDGLLYDTDETLFQPNLVVAVALPHVLMAIGHGDDRAHWLNLAQQQRRQAAFAKANWLWHPSQRASHAGFVGARGPKSFQGMFTS